MTVTQELLRFARLSKLHPLQVIEGIRRSELRELLLSPPVGRDDPEKDRLAVEESPSEGFPVAGVKLLVCQRSA
jgi:hypothetical protein